MLERDSGVFASIAKPSSGPREYGLPYLIEFRSGTPEEIAASACNDAKTIAVLTRKYIVNLLEGKGPRFDEFARFVDERVALKVAQVPELKGTKYVKIGWLKESPTSLPPESKN
jgi:hypothetical protein